jgi:hypothetical protein
MSLGNNHGSVCVATDGADVSLNEPVQLGGVRPRNFTSGGSAGGCCVEQKPAFCDLSCVVWVPSESEVDAS